MKLVKIEKVNEKKDVFDVTVKDSHHYFLENGVLTHNSGGGGVKYAASIIAFLSKSKAKEGDAADGEMIGAKITVKIDKSRFTREQKKIAVVLNHSTGLDRYFGLLDIAIEAGICKQVSTKVQFPNGTSAFKSKINKDPAKYFTKEVLDLIDEACGKMFKYGQDELPEEEEDNE